MALHQAGGPLCGYRFSQVGESPLHFTLSRLSNTQAQPAGLLATIRDSQSLGYLYVSGEELFKGQAEPKQLIKFDFRTSATEPFSCTFADEELADFTLTMTQDEGEIKKKQQRQTLIKFRHDLDTLGSLAVIVDLKGQPLVYPLTLDSLDWLKQERPCALLLQTEAKQPLGHLLIFDSPTLAGTPLFNTQGKRCLLLDLQPGRLIIPAPTQTMPPHFQLLTEAQVFVSDAQRTGVTVDVHGDWLGVAVPATQILQTSTRDLQPTSYFPAEVRPQLLRTPAELLASIKKNQQQLDRRINFLLGITELKPLTGAVLPWPMIRDVVPFGQLNGTQQEVWRRIQVLTDLVTSADGQSYHTPRPFRLEDISQGLSPTDVQSALELFEQMGLIVRVSIEAAPYYRHITVQDVVVRETFP